MLLSTDFLRVIPIHCHNMDDWRILVYCADNGDPIYVSKDLPIWLERLRFTEFVDEPSE